MTTGGDLAQEARAWVEKRAKLRDRALSGWGEGSDAVVGVATSRGEEERVEVATARQWQRELFDAGLAWVDGPVAYGGRDAGPDAARAVRRVFAEYDVPNTGCFIVSFDIVGPTRGPGWSGEQRERWLPPIWRGDVICCQLFSEPEAGSDLANLRTTAVRDGDDWVITGHKVWSSGAHHSELGEILARTGTVAERSAGITAFLVEMDRPGITVRPLRQLTGSEHFNEVVLTEVRIPDANRLGPVGGGWAVAQTTLGGERSVMGDENNGIVNDPVRKLYALAQHLGVADQPAVAELLGEAWARERILHATAVRLADQPTAAGPVAKLLTNQFMAFLVDAAQRLLAERFIVDDGSWGTFVWSDLLLAAPAHRIAGGTDEIQRNIIAERVLGLPREARPASKDSG